MESGTVLAALETSQCLKENPCLPGVYTLAGIERGKKKHNK